MAGKAGKCPKCGDIIHVPEKQQQSQSPQPAGGPGLVAHVEGIKVRGGVQKEEVPLRGMMMEGFARPKAQPAARVPVQALVGSALGGLGLLLGLAPVIPGVEAKAVVGLVGGMIAAFGAAVAGWALLNISQQPAHYKGKPIAFAGIALGTVGLVLGFLVFNGNIKAAAGGAAPSVRSATPPAGVDLSPCTKKLEGAYAFLQAYADDHKGKFPTRVMDLVPRYHSDVTPFQCPVAGDGTRLYESNPGLTVDSPPDTPLLFDRADNHEGGRNVLLVSGDVVFMSEADFQAAKGKMEVQAPEEGGGEDPTEGPSE